MEGNCMIVLVLIGIVKHASTDPSHAVSDKVDIRPLALQDEDNPESYGYASWGKEFVLALTEQHPFGAGTFIYVSCTTVTTINVFAPYVNMNKTLQIRSGTQMISLDNRLMNQRNELANKGVYVIADKPISIYVIENSYSEFATEGYLALPISAISTEYVVVTDNSANRTMSQFVIAALKSNTTVNVTFKTTGTININGIKYSPGNLFSLEMSTLDTIQVQHIYDLTGTFIQSNKPIAVFSGCKCGFGGAVGEDCQHQVEQIVPIRVLGQEYITVPLFPAASYRYRIISPFNNTIASIQGQTYTIQSGNFMERCDTEPLYIHASKPVMVMEYGQSTSGNCQKGSDPSMITIPAISTFSINFTFGLPAILTATNNIHFYILLIIETNRVNDLMLDRQRLKNLEGKYTVMTASMENYTVLVTNITSGYHKLNHPDTSVRYGAVLYGTGQSTSIGFPLGYHTVTATPNVTMVPSSSNSIKILLTKASGYVNGYEVKGTPIFGGKPSIQTGIFLSDQSTATHNFTTLDPPGTCFQFQIVTITWSEILTINSEPVFRDNVCYDPSKPSVTFVPNGIQNIKLIITIIDGQATGYEIKAVSITGGNTYTQKGTFLPNQTRSIYNFTTSDLPGTCFNFRVVTTSGSEQLAGSSEPVIETNVCYGKSTGNISRPVVLSEIQRRTTDVNQLVFHCDFDPSSDPSMLYQVTWYRDKLEAESKLMSSTHTLYSSKEQFISLTYLPETQITLGMTIFCTISATQLNITVPSEPYFVGFEVISKNSLKLKDLEETLVYIRLTVPFGCRSQSEECFLEVNMFYTETGADNCLLPAAVALSNCGVRISSSRWNQSYPLRIATKHGQNLLSISRIYNIRFRTDESFDHDFFRNYTLPRDIQVAVTTDSSDLNGKECHAICDPHMQTFDGRNYENQNEGTYILYKHLKSPVQVQMRTNPCYGFREGPPFCPCGVAIAVGRDVFVVDRCSIPIKIYMPQCDDGTLKGKIKSDGNFYQIYLPSGSWVKITSGISFNIYTYPSISDRMATSGLCGYLDGDVHNDFVLRNGTIVPDYKFEDFNSNWLVKPEEDLFNSNYKSLQSWPRADYLCICGQYQNGHILKSDNCSPDSRKFCPESALNDSLSANCSRMLSTKLNKAIELDPSDFNVSQSKNDTMTEIHTTRNFTENSANYECWSYLNSSLLFKKCSEVPDIHPESFAETCAMDALITKTMFWAPTHLDNAQKRCIYQVTVNQPLSEQIIKKYNVTSNSDEQASNKTINGTGVHISPSLQELKDLDCPMNCNDQGDCIKGRCHCYNGYGSDDCSVDMNKPPDVYGIPNKGVCDLNETSCDRISVLGKDFAKSQNLSCRLSLFQVKVHETRFHDYDSIVLEAEYISFAEVSCPIVDVRSKRSIQFVDELDTLAIGYRVAVGNTREIFGLNISLLIVDSFCVDCIKAGFDITCTLKDGFDLINRRCIKKMSAEKKVEAQNEKNKRERAYAELQEIDKKKDYYGTIEEVYDEIKDLPDDYSTIRNSVPTGNESKDSKESYVKLGSTQKNASEGYSYLNKLTTNECESNARKYENKEQGTSTEETNIRYQKRPYRLQVTMMAQMTTLNKQ